MKTKASRILLAGLALAFAGSMTARPALADYFYSTDTSSVRVIESPVLMERTVESPVTVERVIEKPAVIERTVERPVVLERCCASPTVIERTTSSPVIIEKTGLPHLFHLGLFPVVDFSLF